MGLNVPNTAVYVGDAASRRGDRGVFRACRDAERPRVESRAARRVCPYQKEDRHQNERRRARAVRHERAGMALEARQICLARRAADDDSLQAAELVHRHRPPRAGAADRSEPQTLPARLPAAASDRKPDPAARARAPKLGSWAARSQSTESSGFAQTQKTADNTHAAHGAAACNSRVSKTPRLRMHRLRYSARERDCDVTPRHNTLRGRSLRSPRHVRWTPLFRVLLKRCPSLEQSRCMTAV
jgi:hypothetical protein